MKVGLYFGSFNPIHIGHLIIAGYVSDFTDMDQIWFVISPQNPLKTSANLLNEYDRLYLVRLAIEDDTRFRASDVEFKLPKPSYTIDTLVYLVEKYPEHTFSIIMGSDSFKNITKWKNYELLLKDFHFIVYFRPGYPIESGIQMNKNVLILRAPSMDISATLIRNNIREGKSIRYLVPEKVKEEIEKGAYYRLDKPK